MNWRGIIVTIAIAAVLSMISVKTGVFESQNDVVRLNKDMASLESKMKVHAGNWIHYLETRFNGLSLRQDEYQNSSTLRDDRQDERIKRLEEIIKSTYDHENNIYSVKPSKNVAPLVKETKREPQQ